MLMETIFLFIFVIFTTTVVLCQNPFAKGFSQQMLKNINKNGINNNNINDNSINLGRYLASQRDRFLEKMKQEQQNMMKDFNLGSDGGSLQSFSIAGRGGQLRSPHLPRRQQQQRDPQQQQLGKIGQSPKQGQLPQPWPQQPVRKIHPTRQQFPSVKSQFNQQTHKGSGLQQQQQQQHMEKTQIKAKQRPTIQQHLKQPQKFNQQQVQPTSIKSS